MKTKLFLVSVMLSLLTSSCCSNDPRSEPAYPQSVSGWKERDERGLRILGDFVLKKGETTDNGKIQVKVISLILPDSCAETGSFQRQARARIQFVRLSDNKVLYDDIFVERGTRALSTVKDNVNLDEFGISVIYIYDINFKEGWVYFELRS